MPQKPKATPDDPEQYQRFIEAARAAEADESPKAFDRAFKKIDPRKKSSAKEP
jgi:hypothetical protein